MSTAERYWDDAKVGDEAVSPSMGPVSIESHIDEALSIPGILTEIALGESAALVSAVLLVSATTQADVPSSMA